ncbi:unnamed protein product [Paramecium pentaurelia]|uniref:Uncharacterized protein n=1 Tax=Paramecium pentaurelia TaxID=43138 RepID=A0A8S1YF43_9CILI|nr:unnamed protein product [Paramecium pentaurelia]
MNRQKFYYRQDIIEKTREFQIPTQTRRIIRSKSENKKMINQIIKYSNSATSKSQINALNNITEYNQNSIGQQRINKRRKLIFYKEIHYQDNSIGLLNQLSSQTKIKIIKLPIKEIQKSTEKTQSFSNKRISYPNSFDNQQQFIQSLVYKDQNPDRINKLIKTRLTKSQFAINSHQRDQQTQVSNENQKISIYSYQINQKDQKLIEFKYYIYKLILAFDQTYQIRKGKNKLEDILDNQQRFVGFMNLTYNLINLPLNIEGLGQMFNGTKYLIKILKPYIPQTLEKLIFEDIECQKFKQLTFQYQVFYILNNHSLLIDNITKEQIQFIVRQSKECSDLQFYIEKQFLTNNLYDVDEIQSLFEKQFNQPYEILLNEAKSICNLVIEYDYVKQLYCFCIKVQDTLSEKIKQEGNRKQFYDKGFDFNYNLLKFRQKDMNDEKLLSQLVPKKYEIIQKLDQFESKFGRIDSITNIQREYAKLGNMKHNQLYERIRILNGMNLNIN